MPLLGALGTRPDGADVEINKPGCCSRANGIARDPKMDFRKWCLASVAFRSGWYCGYCIAASAVMVFRGFRYVAAAANVVRGRTRRLENKRAFGRIYVVDAPSGARWRWAGHADRTASRFPTRRCPSLHQDRGRSLGRHRQKFGRRAGMTKSMSSGKVFRTRRDRCPQ
jgi:hypothetical protein